MTSEIEFLTSYGRIKESYVNTMKQIDEAIGHEENERPLDAITAYDLCLQRIEETFAIPVGLPDDIDAVETEWNDACALIQKLKSTKMEVSYRLKVLRDQNALLVDTAVEEATEAASSNDHEELDGPAAKRKSALLDNPPTSYAIGNATTGTTKTYKEVINGLRQVIATKNCDVLFDTLFQSQAKLYKIQANGEVSTIAGDTTMSVVMCTVGGRWQFLNGSFFIQCAIPDATSPVESASTSTAAPDLIWIYLLVPAITTCYRTEYGAFILPDMESGVPGNAFGLMVIDPNASGEVENENDDLSDYQQFFLDLLEAILAGPLEQLRGPRGTRDTSERISKGIVNAAEFIAQNLVRGAEKTGQLMHKSTPYVISKIDPAVADAPVSSKVQTSVEVAKKATSVAAGVSCWMAEKVGSASMAVGRYLAPHVQTQGARVLESGFGYDSTEANKKMEGVLTVAAGAAEGVSTLFNGLENSAKILGNHLSDNSVMIIKHKYGHSAGDVAAGTFDIIGNAFTVSQNVNYMTPKGIAKKMAKQTGKAVINGFMPNSRDESRTITAGALYPDLRKLHG